MRLPLTLLLTGVLHLSAQQASSSQEAAPAPAADGPLVTLVAVGSIPKSVVKWNADGQHEYVMVQPQGLPPANLHVRAPAKSKKDFLPLNLTLNIPSAPVRSTAGRLPLFQGADGSTPSSDAQPLLNVPITNGTNYQLVLMYRKNPASDWKSPSFHPCKLDTSSFPQGATCFVNLSDKPARLQLAQSGTNSVLQPGRKVIVPAPKSAYALAFRIDTVDGRNQIKPVASSGIRIFPDKRQVITLYTSAEKEVVCGQFIVPDAVAPATEN